MKGTESKLPTHLNLHLNGQSEMNLRRIISSGSIGRLDNKWPENPSILDVGARIERQKTLVFDVSQQRIGQQVLEHRPDECQKPSFDGTSQKTVELMIFFGNCSPLWLLPAERPIGQVGFAPTENRRLSRHTRFLTRVRENV